MTTRNNDNVFVNCPFDDDYSDADYVRLVYAWLENKESV